ncbi:MAG: hypothetical protein LBJ82_04675 [Deltaproteobacteria bacterium]|jgi:hypothetical protein|nr:hypothetical protein [Deltaproteobacteria bacterium]
MRSGDSPAETVLFFHESPAFRRLAYFLSSPDFSSRQEARRLDPETAKKYRRALSGLRRRLQSLEQAPARDKAWTLRAAEVAAEAHAALSGALDLPSDEAQTLARLERSVDELGALAAEILRTDHAPGQRQGGILPSSFSRQAVAPSGPVSAGSGRAGRKPETSSAAPGPAVGNSPVEDGESGSCALRSASAACGDLLLKEASRQERAARVWGSLAGLCAFLSAALCLYPASDLYRTLFGRTAPLFSAGSSWETLPFSVPGAALGALFLICAVLLAAMAGCWRMFRTKEALAADNRQRAVDLAAAAVLAVADPAAGTAFWQNAVPALCRKREEN